MSSSCVLITSCSKSYRPNELVRQILKVDEIPDGETVIENITGYDWHIDTKYYTANIKLCCTDKRTIGNEMFAESVQGFIVYFDAEQEESFDLAKAWLPYLKQIEPSVLMLVCENCTEDTNVKRLKAQEWCIDNDFELVELSPLEENSDIEDDFQETTGIKRVIQALHAHTWPDLVMKDRPNIHSPYMQQLMDEESMRKSHISKGDNSSAVTSAQEEQGFSDNKEAGAVVENGLDEKKNTEKAVKKSKTQVIDSLIPMDDLELFEAVGAEDPGEESFEKLFANFRLMKEKAECLPPEERKVYAEKVAMSFWKAIGGDDEEIQGLSDSDEGPT